MQILNPDLLITGKAYPIETRAKAITLNIPRAFNLVETGGYTTSGDGGAALYQRSAGVPAKPGYFQDNTGAYWALVSNPIKPQMFGAVPGTDSTTALQAMLNYGGNILWTGYYIISGNLLVSVNGTNIKAAITQVDGIQAFSAASVTGAFCVVNPTKNVTIDGLRLTGIATTAVADSWDHYAIRFNTNALGTAWYHLTNDDPFDMLYGQVLNCLFDSTIAGTNGWNAGCAFHWCGGNLFENNRVIALYGVTSGNGYGCVCSGPHNVQRGNYFKPTVPNQGRHAIYNSYAENYLVENNEAHDFQYGVFVTNTGTTSGGVTISNTGGIFRGNFGSHNVLTNQQDSAFIELNHQGGSTYSGLYTFIDNNRSDDAYQMFNLRGVDFVVCTDNTAINTRGRGLWIQECDNARIENFNSITNVNVPLFSHIVVQCSDNVRIRGGSCINSGAGTQRCGVGINASVPLASNCITEDVLVLLTGGGTWDAGQFENINQSGSVMRPYGPYVPGAVSLFSYHVDTTVGANQTIDVSAGYTAIKTDAGLVSIDQFTPAGIGQVVTVIPSAALTINNANIYPPANAPLVMGVNDAAMFVCISTAPILWRCVSYSDN